MVKIATDKEYLTYLAVVMAATLKVKKGKNMIHHWKAQDVLHRALQALIGQFQLFKEYPGKQNANHIGHKRMGSSQEDKRHRRFTVSVLT